MARFPATIGGRFEPLTEHDRFLSDVIHGLGRPQKAIPCKYFYDERGAALFDAICELDEYYLTRTELAIMAASVREIAAVVGEDIELIEFGPGSGQKSGLLLEHLRSPRAYIPIEISPESLERSARETAARFPSLLIHSVCADFTRPVKLPGAALDRSRRVVYFPGSTIGNLVPTAACSLLRSIADLVGDGGGLLIGFDVDKDESIVWPAYNDSQGVTAEFNLNLLARINREIGADFNLEAFEHRADYVRTKERVEIHLASKRPQVVDIDGQEFAFRAGELIHTEYSYKYRLGHFEGLTREAGFRLVRQWTDARAYFCVQYLIVD
jgi:dimethylhistidine N-methyltransferase